MGKKIFTDIHHPITNCTLCAVEVDHVLQIEELRLGLDSTIDQSSLERLAFFKQMILEYLDGSIVDLSILPLNLSRYSPFQQKVLNTARAIPRGITLTYEELACQSGFPGAFRAVGTVMRRNAFPLIIPCHRVVLKSGKIGGYCGMQHGDMTELKKKLLKMEGCRMPVI